MKRLNNHRKDRPDRDRREAGNRTLIKKNEKNKYLIAGKKASYLRTNIDFLIITQQAGQS